MIQEVPPQEDLAQRENIEQPQKQEQQDNQIYNQVQENNIKNDYKEILGNTIAQTTFIDETNPIQAQSITATNTVKPPTYINTTAQPIVFNNAEDLNKYFQPNAYTQNTNLDLASLGLGTSTTVQGATSAEEINKYFQGSNTYNTGNVDLGQYGYDVTNQSGNVNYSEYKVTNSTQNYAYNY